MSAIKNKDKKLLLTFLFILALMPRIVLAVFSNQAPLGDEVDYNQLAIRILQGQPYHSNVLFGLTNARPPLYPLFIAVIYFFTNHSIFAVKLMQAVLGALTCIIVFFIAENLFKNRRISFGVGLICAFYPVFISVSNFLLSETLYTFLSALAIIFLLKDYDHSNLKNKFLSGLFLGLAALTRSVTLAFVPFLILWLFFSSSKNRLSRFKRTAIVILFMSLTILPWTVRNYIVFKEFVPINTNGGIVFYRANNNNTLTKIFDPELFCNADIIPLSKEQKEEILLLPEPARDRYFYSLGWKFAVSHPKEFLKLRLISFSQFWRLWPLTPAKYKQYYLKEGANRSPLLDKLVDTYFLYFIKILYHLPYNILFIGMLLSPINSFKRKLEFRKSLLLILLIVTMCLFYSVQSTGGDRYRMPIDPYVFLLGLSGISTLKAKK